MKIFIPILSAVLFSLSACGNAGGPSGSSVANTISNAAIKAALDVESTKPDTTVNYTSYTMTQSGKKVGFEIVPASGHQDDFKAGSIKETNKNGVDNVTLFLYKVNDKDQLSLMEPASAGNVVSYVTTISERNPHILNGKDAVSYLKNQLAKNDDYTYHDVEDNRKADNIGAYFTVQLVTNEGSGGTCLYRVYHNGSYRLVGLYEGSSPQNLIDPRNINDIRGFVPDKNQTFMVNLKSWGNVKFVSGKITGGQHIPTVFYLTNENGDILYAFDDPFPYNVEVKAVSFQDVNKDGLQDIILIVSQKDNAGNRIAAVFLQNSNKTFTVDRKLDQKKNQSGYYKNIKTVTDYLSKLY